MASLAIHKHATQLAVLMLYHSYCCSKKKQPIHGCFFPSSCFHVSRHDAEVNTQTDAGKHGQKMLYGH